MIISYHFFTSTQVSRIKTNFAICMVPQVGKLIFSPGLTCRSILGKSVSSFSSMALGLRPHAILESSCTVFPSADLLRDKTFFFP